MAKKTLLVVGLGNPGEKYAHTRHNVGFEVMSRLEEYYGVKLRRKFLLQGQTAEITDGETKIVLCEPLTYMNKSGECIRKLLNRFKVPQEQMIVIFDDIDLPPGKVRVRKNGGAGTHDWVLGRPSGEEKEKMEAAFGKAAEVVRIWIKDGIEAAMQKGNQN